MTLARKYSRWENFFEPQRLFNISIPHTEPSESSIRSSENNAPETSQAQVIPQHSPQVQAQNPQQVSTLKASPAPQQVSTLEASPAPQQVGTRSITAPQQVSTLEASPALQQVSTPEVSPAVQQIAANQVSPSSSNFTHTTQNISRLPKLSLPHLMETLFTGKHFGTRLTLQFIQAQILLEFRNSIT